MREVLTLMERDVRGGGHYGSVPTTNEQGKRETLGGGHYEVYQPPTSRSEERR